MRKVLNVEGIRKLSISTVEADVDIVPEVERKKLVYEVFGEAEDYSPEIKKQGDTLVLKFEPERKLLGFLPLGHSSGVRRVKVYVPYNMKEINVKSTSGDITARDLELDNLVMNTVSGDLSISHLDTKAFNASTVSGCFSGKELHCYERCHVSTISGDCYLDLRNGGPDEMRLSSVSGDITLFLENFEESEIRVSSISGTFSHSIPLMKVAKGVYRTSDIVNRRFMISSVSGDVNLKSVEYRESIVDDTTGECGAILGEEARKIIQLLKDGRLTKEQAREFMMALGYEEDEISSLLDEAGKGMEV